MNCRIGKLSLLVVVATLASNAVAMLESSSQGLKSLTNLFSGSTELVNQSKEFLALAQSSMQDTVTKKSALEWAKENKRGLAEVVSFACLICCVCMIKQELHRLWENHHMLGRIRYSEDSLTNIALLGGPNSDAFKDIQTSVWKSGRFSYRPSK